MLLKMLVFSKHAPCVLHKLSRRSTPRFSTSLFCGCERSRLGWALCRHGRQLVFQATFHVDLVECVVSLPNHSHYLLLATHDYGKARSLCVYLELVYGYLSLDSLQSHMSLCLLLVQLHVIWCLEEQHAAMRSVITSLMLSYPSCRCFLYRRRVQKEHVKQRICVYYTKDERTKREGETEIWHN